MATRDHFRLRQDPEYSIGCEIEYTVLPARPYLSGCKDRSFLFLYCRLGNNFWVFCFFFSFSYDTSR